MRASAACRCRAIVAYTGGTARAGAATRFQVPAIHHGAIRCQRALLTN